MNKDIYTEINVDFKTIVFGLLEVYKELADKMLAKDVQRILDLQHYSLCEFFYNRINFSPIQDQFERVLLEWREFIFTESQALEMIEYRDMWE